VVDDASRVAPLCGKVPLMTAATKKKSKSPATKERRSPVRDPETDPVLRAMARAPEGPPMTDEERRALVEAKAVGHWTSGAEVSAEIARCNTGK
jgi:hypothetical protein